MEERGRSNGVFSLKGGKKGIAVDFAPVKCGAEQKCRIGDNGGEGIDMR